MYINANNINQTVDTGYQWQQSCKLLIQLVKLLSSETMVVVKIGSNLLSFCCGPKIEHPQVL
jgi:hypothetical protein